MSKYQFILGLGLFLEITHERPNFFDMVKEEYMKPGHKFILHVRDMLNQNLHEHQSDILITCHFGYL